MNKKDLDALNELYLSVYGEEQLEEAPVTGNAFVDRILQGGQAFFQGKPRPTGVVTPEIRSSQERKDRERRATNQSTHTARSSGSEANPPSAAQARKDEADPRRNQAPTRSSGSEANPPSAADARKDEADPRRNPTRAGSPPLNTAGRLTGSSSAPPSRPAAATPAAAQPKPATPAVGKLGNTSFERRTPTSAELRAAQGARDKGASPEKALQAAQKTNLPTTGPTPATPDLGSVGRDLARANTVANLNRAPAGSAAAKALAAKPATSAPTPTQIAGASQGIKPINNTNPQKKLETVKSSYEWPSAKTIRDIADAYSSIYEAKKVDQDQDGDNDFADVRIARLIASGVSKEEAIRRVRDKSYNEAYVPWDFGPKDKAKAKHTELAARKEAGGSAPGTATRANRIASVAKDMRTTLDKNSAATGTNPARQGLQPATQRHTAAALRGAGGGMTASKVYDVKPLKPASKGPKGGGSSAQGVGSPSGTGRYQVGGGQGYGISGIKLADEFELWVNELVEEGYDLSEYTWEDMFDIYEETQLDEATRMRKELGKEGETATRKELARRSNAYQRSGSVDRTIAAAERGADRTTARNRDESEGDYKTRMQKRSQTLNKLAANRRKSVRSGEGLRGYAAKVEGSDRDLQSARGSARSAGTLTPREKKQLNREAYEAYEFVASYLLENNFAETLNDANVIIENMSDNWFESIMEDIRGASYTPNPIGNAIRAGAGLLKNTMNRPSVQGAIKTGSQMLQKSVPSGGYSTREGDGKPRETPLWDGPSKPTPTTPTKPQTKKQPPMRDEPLW